MRAPRQVGKTTLAKEIAKQHKRDAVYLDLESTVDRRRLTDAEAFLSAQRGKLVVIDEIHRAPDLFDTLRGVIDERRSTGAHTAQFLLLGSAGIDLMRQSSESLAGRVAYIELPAIDVLEFAKRDSDVDRLWVRGGFPESLLARNDALSLA